jgi:hypothetical protein
MTDAPAQRSPSTVTNESKFTPLTPDTGSSEYSPVSDAEPEEQTAKTEAQAEDLLLAQLTQALTGRQSTT